jgi:hypothetical protein
MVQMSRAAQIKEDWVRRGKPTCTHERTDKEYDLGSQTGDLVCMDCGLSWWAKDEVPPPEPGEESEG